MKRCPKCGVRVMLLKSVEGPNIVVHTEPGDPPYRYCKYATAAMPETIGEWASKLLRPQVN